jgi:hypothetical protein
LKNNLEVLKPFLPLYRIYSKTEITQKMKTSILTLETLAMEASAVMALALVEDDCIVGSKDIIAS